MEDLQEILRCSSLELTIAHFITYFVFFLSSPYKYIPIWQFSIRGERIYIFVPAINSSQWIYQIVARAFSEIKYNYKSHNWRIEWCSKKIINTCLYTICVSFTKARYWNMSGYRTWKLSCKHRNQKHCHSFRLFSSLSLDVYAEGRSNAQSCNGLIVALHFMWYGI